MAASSNQVVRGRAGTYQVSQSIGKGAYGEVFLVKSKKDRKLVSSIRRFMATLSYERKRLPINVRKS